MRLQISLEIIFSMLIALSIACLLSAAVSSPTIGFAADSRAIAGISGAISQRAEGLLRLCGSCRAGGR
jgi:hypothetical protein